MHEQKDISVNIENSSKSRKHSITLDLTNNEAFASTSDFFFDDEVLDLLGGNQWPCIHP